jgi:murein L,D-transpeptidase YafK
MGLLLLVLSISARTTAQVHLSDNTRADRVLVVKSARTLTLLNHEQVLKVYKVALGGVPLGPKTRQGDHRTPEGIYVLDRRNDHSKFYRAIHISYPNAQDRERARELGASPGGDIMLHGLPNGYGWIGKGHRARDWTDGCIAVTDALCLRSMFRRCKAAAYQSVRSLHA